MCRIVGGYNKQGVKLLNKYNKRRGHNIRGVLMWWEITLKEWGKQEKGEGSCAFCLTNFQLLINSNFEKKMF